MKKITLILLTLIALWSCKNNEEKLTPADSIDLTIFFVNDQHGQLENFSKIKHIVDLEEQETNVIVACSGDMFSGNPVVDNYPEKGYPMIDLMNKVGFDVSVIGNHEFDYGQQVLKERMEDADFDWVCANVDMGSTVIPEPLEYVTLSIDSFDITFLGLVETNGKPGAVIPSTHPGKIQNITFQRAEDIVANYANVKEEEDSDLYIALTHLGHDSYYGGIGDFQLAQQFPYFDLIIGGHTNQLLDTLVNGIPVFMANAYLNYLGKIDLTVQNKKVTNIDFELIDLNTYTEFDSEIKAIIDNYNAEMTMVLQEVIGFSAIEHQRYQVGCFYTDALRGRLSVDASFQNTGGIRSPLDAGDITVREIYEIDPFNNGTLVYNMTVADIKTFLSGTGSWFYYSGLEIDQVGSDIIIKDLDGNSLDDNTNLTIGINDYIPAVHDSYFPVEKEILDYNTAEAIIYYLKNINDQVNYPGCARVFRYE